MSALPRPDIPPGPLRDLNDALHDLHHRAGWPSLRTLAGRTGVSHTTVSKSFSTPALPRWGNLELIVESLGGDPAHFRDLWLAAGAPAEAPAPAACIAGRRGELATVRRHLETGTGLLLVTGEAGIGKTTLVEAAAEGSDTFVAAGHCRPLASPVPFLPIAELLRGLLHTNGTWFREALQAAPSYVSTALSPLLPEIDAPTTAAGHELARHRLFAAVTDVLESLAQRHPLALLVEDLPWADSSNLDLVEHLVSRGLSVPVVGTWRTEDPETPEGHDSWRSRLARSATELALEPLSLEETTDQLVPLLGADRAASDAAQIFRRSGGQPLFTEQLAKSSGGPDALPGILDELLSRRLRNLDPADWRLVRALGVADRPLTVAQLTRVSDREAEPTPALRSLIQQHLVTGDDHTVALRHPLIAEAVRKRCAPGEAAGVHHAVAELLSDLEDPPAAEIAGHWRAAGEPDRELTWRLRAALTADERFAPRESFPEWRRSLELWGLSAVPEEAREVGLARVHTRVIDTAVAARRGVDIVRTLVDDAMRAQLPEQGRAEVLIRAGDLECAHGDPALGLRHLDDAVAIAERHPATSETGHALEVRANIHVSLGHDAEAAADVARGLAIAIAVDDLRLRRRQLGMAAWFRFAAGDPIAARSLALEARTALPAEADPVGALRIAWCEIAILLATGATAVEVEQAAREAIAQADRWGIDNVFADHTFDGLAEAHLRAGAVQAAAAVVEPRAAGRTGNDLVQTRAALCSVQIARGELSAAHEGLRSITDLGNYASGEMSRDQIRAVAHLWSGEPEEAVACLRRATDFGLTTDIARELSGLLATLARAQADAADARRARASDRQAVRVGMEELRAGAAVDPFGADALGADVSANQAVWSAELARLEGADSVEHWTRASAAWDRLSRPHDAAYCRWRAAQCALREGRGTVAARLLKRAATDAREHVPLSGAIAKTAAKGQ